MGDPINYTDPSGHFQYKAPGPNEDRAIGWYLENRFGDTNVAGDTVHIEYGIPSIYAPRVYLRPDILLPKTGDVYEIEPYATRATGVAEAILYSDLLTYAGGGGWQIGSQMYVQGIGVLPSSPIDWNTRNLWHLGRSSSFPYVRIKDQVISTRGERVAIPRYLTLVALSPEDGLVMWWYEPSDEFYAFAAGAAAGAGQALLEKLRQKYGENLREPGPPVPEGEPVGAQAKPSQSTSWTCPDWLLWLQSLDLFQ